MANTNVTLPSTLKFPLAAVEEISGGFTHKFTIPYTQVNTGTGNADTVTVALGTSPTKWAVSQALVNVTTAFAGTTSFSLVVGTTTTTNAFVSTADLISVGAVLIPMTSTLPILTNARGTTAIGLQALFTNATGGSPSALTAGSLDLYLTITDVSQLP